VIKFLIVFNLE